ncbi:hypothetical protein BN8_04085 [Fibrisoma limi BUZ 3]|uniref:TonB C-terminal domain-containing protein n=1 Tax=Fibrisoma limi BUZ 3 TaxID=1185876 RepID=I2GLU5_9BACT|nr:TonB family protein [Fibrisoma limi]CCH54871.1 hypothetical protein BN8_04085 [Fibrisoma limi BUZ 3]
MSRAAISFLLFWLISLSVSGQCDVSQDSAGRIITTCQVYSTSRPNEIKSYHKQTVYLGSEYFTYPIWQQGTVWLDNAGQPISCQIAYSLVDQKVYCRFNGSLTSRVVTPESFSINGLLFTRRQPGSVGRGYLAVLRNGQTKLLLNLQRHLVTARITDGYAKGDAFDGSYQTRKIYYIQKGDAQPEPIDLTRPSLLNALYDQAEKLAERFPETTLTTETVVNALAYYDQLTAATGPLKPALSMEPVFTQALHNRIKYPSRAWNEGVYGRVYIRFEITKRGEAINITSLSPENNEYGFDQAVKQALRKLSVLKPVYAGKYVLPVAFTFTNTLASTSACLPTRTLSPDQLADCTILEEFTVPIVVTKKVGTCREIWGTSR